MSFSPGRAETKVPTEVKETKAESKDLTTEPSAEIRRLQLHESIARVMVLLQEASPRSQKKVVDDLQIHVNEAHITLQSRVKPKQATTISADIKSDAVLSPGDSKRSTPIKVLQNADMVAELLSWGCPEVEVKKLGTDGYLSVQKSYELIKKQRDVSPEYVSGVIGNKAFGPCFRSALTSEERKSIISDYDVSTAIEFDNIAYIEDVLKTNRSAMKNISLKEVRSLDMLKLLAKEFINKPWELEYYRFKESCSELLIQNCYEEFKAIQVAAKRQVPLKDFVIVFLTLCDENNIVIAKKLQADKYDLCLQDDKDYSCIKQAAGKANMEFFKLFYTRLRYPISQTEIDDYFEALKAAANLDGIKDDPTPQQIEDSKEMVRLLIAKFFERGKRSDQDMDKMLGLINNFINSTPFLRPGVEALMEGFGIPKFQPAAVSLRRS